MNVTKQRIKKNLTLFIFIFLVGNFGYAQMLPNPLPSPIQIGAYLPGLIGPRDYANPEFSGIAVIDYNLFISADKYKDRNGDEVNSIDIPELGPVPIDIDLSGYLNALVVAYVSPELEFLGNARYIGALAYYYATVDARVSYSVLQQGGTVEGGSSGFGDLMVVPLLLTWTGENRKWDITTGYLFAAPTGRYETGADDNIGLGYWNHIFQLFGYYYPLPQKATAIYVGNSFELHSKIKDTDVKPGSRYALDYGISQYLSARFEVFVQGGHIWQVGEDSGNDVYWDTSFKDRVSSIGGGVGFWPVPTKFYANIKYLTNYGGRQHFNTKFWELQLVWIPWKKEKGVAPADATGRASFRRPFKMK